MYTETKHVAEEESLSKLPSISFPIEYFISLNEYNPTTTTPHNFQCVQLLPPPSPELFDSEEYRKILKFFLKPGTFQGPRKLNYLQSF